MAIAAPVPPRHVRIPALDGLRGLAVLLVMALHYRIAPWPWTGLLGGALYGIARAGWSGVDLFFVLSGFLITGILWDDRTKPHYFRDFYARRTLRIFPLYYVTLGVIFLLLPRVWPAPFPPLPLHEQLWYWTYTTNIRTSVGSFAGMGLYTTHFWTLAIEEQFYLVWPAAMRRISLRGAMRVAGATVLVAILVRCTLLSMNHLTATYTFTFSRMDSLAIGALLALAARRPQGLGPFLGRPWTWLGIGAAGVAALILWRGTVSDVDHGIAAIGYTVVAFWWATVLGAVLAGTALTRLFSGSVIRWIGRRSYAIYVFHYPIMVLFRTGWSFTKAIERAAHASVEGYALFVALNVALSLFAAEISWRLLEARALRLKERFRAEDAVALADAGRARVTETPPDLGHG
jgi:peptidoglycan/LPS O-acetylase OafA/YrhL